MRKMMPSIWKCGCRKWPAVMHLKLPWTELQGQSMQKWKPDQNGDVIKKLLWVIADKVFLFKFFQIWQWTLSNTLTVYVEHMWTLLWSCWLYIPLHYKSCIKIACDAWLAAIQDERKNPACSLHAMVLANQEGIIGLVYSSKTRRIWWVDCLVDEKLFGWLHPESSRQWLNVQVEIGDEWCPSVVHIGTSTV